MNRLMRGSVVLAAVLGVAACAGDPFEGERGNVEKLVANPTSVFVDEGDSETILVEAVDAAGHQSATDFEITNVGAGITVQVDPSYSPVYGGEPINTRVRLIVTGNSMGSTTFTVSAGGKSLTVPVRVVPTTLAATVSNANPAAGDTVRLTAPANVTFGPDAAVTFETGGDALVISNTGTELAFLPFPGSTGTVEVSGIELSFAPGASFTVALATSISVGPTPAAMPGTDAQGTAPVVAEPTAAAPVTGVIDAGTWAGDCGGVPCQWYRLDVTTDGSFEFSAHWDNTADLGIYVFEADGTTEVGHCDAHGNGVDAQPEECSLSLAAGTYYVQMQNFAPFYPDPDPAWFFLTITRE